MAKNCFSFSLEWPEHALTGLRGSNGASLKLQLHLEILFLCLGCLSVHTPLSKLLSAVQAEIGSACCPIASAILSRSCFLRVLPADLASYGPRQKTDCNCTSALALQHLCCGVVKHDGYILTALCLLECISPSYYSAHF